MSESVIELVQQVAKEIESPEKETTLEQHVQIIVLNIGGEFFGVDILQISEIVRPKKITRVPKSSANIKGVMNLRGNVIPILDLRVKFNLPMKEETEFTRIAVVEIKKKLIGLYVDEISNVIRLPKSGIEPPPPILKGIIDKYIIGIGKENDKLIILLNLISIMQEEGIITED
jgi:purine-binding chemotaxis protein CheW